MVFDGNDDIGGRILINLSSDDRSSIDGWTDDVVCRSSRLTRSMRLLNEF
jgi:hypothetical protein